MLRRGKDLTFHRLLHEEISLHLPHLLGQHLRGRGHGENRRHVLQDTLRGVNLFVGVEDGHERLALAASDIDDLGDVFRGGELVEIVVPQHRTHVVHGAETGLEDGAFLAVHGHDFPRRFAHVGHVVGVRVGVVVEACWFDWPCRFQIVGELDHY